MLIRSLAANDASSDDADDDAENDDDDDEEEEEEEEEEDVMFPGVVIDLSSSRRPNVSSTCTASRVSCNGLGPPPPILLALL